SVDRFERSRLEDTRCLRDLHITRKAAWLGLPPLGPLVVSGDETDDPAHSLAEVEQERRIEPDEVSDVRTIETSGGVLKADLAYRAGRLRPPCVDGSIGESKVGCQVAEQ